MFKKLHAYVERKEEEWSEKKFVFVFIKLPYIVLAVYSVFISILASWSIYKNIEIAKDFIKLEESYERLKQSYQQREQRQMQLLRQQLERQQQGNLNQ